MLPAILSFKPGHDGSIAYINDGRLVFSFEAEKDSFPRYSEITASTIVEALAAIDRAPDIVAVSGWVRGFHSIEPPLEAGYYGAHGMLQRLTRFAGKPAQFFSSTHERSHILGCYAMSSFPQGQPCYMLLWEGTLGSFYEIGADLSIVHLGHVMDEPGHKYAFLYSLADPSYRDVFRFSVAGKLMALGSFSSRSVMSPEERQTVDYILDTMILRTHRKDAMLWSRFHNIGLDHPDFRELAGKHANALFQRFFQFAEKHLTKGHPLLIGGGCGLNCEWNTQWAECGLFPQVFVPPVANDTGSAIGTAVDALHVASGHAKLEWNVYAGQEFVMDAAGHDDFAAGPAHPESVAALLNEGAVLAWAQGCCEIGPRALGNRSLLASPLSKSMHTRLNGIKEREDYRPIAPVALEEDAAKWFSGPLPSPHMLFVQRVLSDRLPAVTHVDGTARAQTVNARQNPALHALLLAVKRHSGVGVLCNTSLNFSGRGFINRFSHLVQFARERELDGFVVGETLYRRMGGCKTPPA